MKLSEFKALEALKPPPDPPSFGQSHGKRRMIRDSNADQFDLDCLDAAMCPLAMCFGDLTVRLSPSGNKNILYYECQKDATHKYARVKTPATMLTTGHMRVIAAAQESLTMQLDAASHRQSATASDDGMPVTTSNIDHMGRPLD